MAKAIWSGSIAFGLVNIPVRLFTATSSHHIDMHMFQKGTGQRIRFKRVAEDSGKEVPYDNIVRGAEVGKGDVVLLTPEELEAMEPRKTRAIDIEDFVDLDAIDPLVWNDTYYVGPDQRSEKAYQLFRKAMMESGKVGIGRFVMREKEHLVTLRPHGSGLALETMSFADEVRDASEHFPAREAAVPARELEMAKQLIVALSGPWKHAKYQDTYRDKVADLIKRMARGEKVRLPGKSETPGKVIDLMEALKKSLAGAGEADRRGTRAETPPRRRPRKAASAATTGRKRVRTPRGKTRSAKG